MNRIVPTKKSIKSHFDNALNISGIILNVKKTEK